MKALYKKSMVAKDLPLEWQKEGGFAPNEQVRVVIEPTDPELGAAASLTEVMDIVGARAQERGLTDETLQSALHDER